MKTKNIIFSKKLLALLLASSIGLTLVGCKKEKESELLETTFAQLVETNKTDSYFDDVMDMNETVNIEDDSLLKQKSLKESINKLEQYIDLEQLIKELELLETTQEIDEDRKEELQKLTYDEVIEEIVLYKSNQLKDVEEARLAMELKYLEQYYETWINSNGVELAESILKRIIKSAACYVSGLEPENYKDCYISEPEYKYSLVTVNDKHSNSSFEYKLTEDSKIYYDALNHLYSIQQLDYSKKDRNLLIDALNIAKICIETPVTLSDDNNIIPTITIEEAKEKVLSYTTTTE